MGLDTFHAIKDYKHIDMPTKKNNYLAMLKVDEQDLRTLKCDGGIYSELLKEITSYTQLHSELIQSFLPEIYQIKINDSTCHRGNVISWQSELQMVKEHIEFYEREIKMINPDTCSGLLHWVLQQWKEGYIVIKELKG